MCCGIVSKTCINYERHCAARARLEIEARVYYNINEKHICCLLNILIFLKHVNRDRERETYKIKLLLYDLFIYFIFY